MCIGPSSSHTSSRVPQQIYEAIIAWRKWLFGQMVPRTITNRNLEHGDVSSRNYSNFKTLDLETSLETNLPLTGKEYTLWSQCKPYLCANCSCWWKAPYTSWTCPLETASLANSGSNSGLGRVPSRQTSSTHDWTALLATTFHLSFIHNASELPKAISSKLDSSRSMALDIRWKRFRYLSEQGEICHSSCKTQPIELWPIGMARCGLES